MKRLFLHAAILCLSNYLVASYNITGTPANITKNIENRLDYKIQPHQTRGKQQLDQIRYETTEAIKPYGYYAPRVKVTQLDGTIHIAVELGKIIHISKITYEIKPTIDDVNIIETLDGVIHSYQLTPFSTTNINQLQEDLEFAVRQQGYSQAQTQRDTTKIDLTQPNNNQIHFIIQPGPKIHFGQTHTSDPAQQGCINKYLAFKPGDPYSSHAVQLTQSNLIEYSPYKETLVSPVTNPDNPNAVDIVIDTKLLEPMSYALGLGVVSSSEQNQSFEPNFLANLTINNILDCGGKLINSLNISPQDSQITSDLYIPSPSVLSDYYLISTHVRSFLQQSEDAGKYYMLSLLAYKSYKNLSFQPSINYLIETSSIDNPNIDDNPNSYITKLLYPKAKLNWLKKHSKGYTLLKAKAMGSVKNINSDLSFFRTSGTAKNTISPAKFFVENQISYGEIITEQFDILPLSMQFTLGGPESLRGYEYQQLNQGKQFFLSRNTVQMRFDSLLIGGFFDSGYCTNTDQRELIKTAGAAFTYETPYSRFNLSIGKPLNGGQWVTLFSIDPEM